MKSLKTTTLNINYTKTRETKTFGKCLMASTFGVENELVIFNVKCDKISLTLKNACHMTF